MDIHCFLVGRKDSLFRQLVASLLVDMIDNLDLHANTTIDFKVMLDEIRNANPNMVLLEETSPFSENSLTIRLLDSLPGLPLIVISEDSNLIRIIHSETRILGSSRDLIETMNLVHDQHLRPDKENDIYEKTRPPDP